MKRQGNYKRGPDCPAYRHGLKGTSIYNIWINMRRRCHDPENAAYESYGARGITVCDRWRNDVAAFDVDMGPRPSRRHSVERKDNSLGYSPGNCVWATPVEQQTNRCDTRMYAHQGKTQCLTHWAREFGLDHRTVARRLDRGLDIADALSPDRLRRKDLTLRGRTQSLPEWSRELSIKQETLWGRVLKGWADEAVLTTPVVSRKGAMDRSLSRPK